MKTLLKYNFIARAVSTTHLQLWYLIQKEVLSDSSLGIRKLFRLVKTKIKQT